MDQQTLDDSYNNTKAVPESPAMFNAWIERSKAFRAAHSQYLDISYGTLEREKIDYYSAGPNTPVVIFIHGGFWQARSKNDFAFLAENYLKEGISVAMVGYPLAPQANMDQIVASSEKAVKFISQHLSEWGGNPKNVVLSGWSSGGHLSVTSINGMKVKAVVPISGIFELEPLTGSFLNKNLQMDVAIAKRNSPMLNLPRGKTPIYLFVGGIELSEMRRQSYDFADKLKASKYPVVFVDIPGKDHYTMLEQFEFPEGAIHSRIVSVIKQKN
ncbi:alpha/beta hydrolase [Polynucleobacter paneuropaeus]|nr:alpha/beta hydrolase [Polynucleobacter paneuropaeus]MBT8636103.1 alpha/beta hydrolase [Polynucleobacter paneuropaeus]MBT8637910.1 alpha/beta hydrolase [Polynucleobacter paneuropaeus]